MNAHVGQLASGWSRIADLLHRIDEIAANAAHGQRKGVMGRRRADSVLLQIRDEARVGAEVASSVAAKVSGSASAIEPARIARNSKAHRPIRAAQLREAQALQVCDRPVAGPEALAVRGPPALDGELHLPRF